MTPPRPVWVFAAALGIAAATTIASSLVESPDPPEPGSRDVPVASATVVCPGPLTAPDILSVVSTLTPPEAFPDLPPQGAASLLRLGTPEEPVTLPPIGVVGRWVPPADGQGFPVVVTADGSSAPGMLAQQSTRVANGPARGRSGVSCAAPGTDFWFVGGGADVGRLTTVHLTNVGDEPAQVDLVVYGAAGSVESPGSRGVIVLPGEQIRVAVDALAPGLVTTALHVVTTTGSVSAAVSDGQLSGLDPLGSDWVPVSAPPSPTVVVPGLSPVTDGTRTLSLLAPGDDPAVANLQFVAPDGTFAPTGQDVIELEPGVLTDIDLSAVAPEVWSSLLITADQPIVAGVRQVRGAAGEVPDYAYLAGTAALSGPAAILDGGRNATNETVLVLAAPVGGVTGTLVITPDGGAPVSTPFEVAAGTTSVLPLAPEGNGAFTVIVDPASTAEPLHAARWVIERGARGPLVTAQPLTTAPISVVQRAARLDLRTGLTSG